MAWFFSGKDYGNLLHPSYSPDHLFKLLQYIFVYCEEVKTEVKIEYFFAMKSVVPDGLAICQIDKIILAIMKGNVILIKHLFVSNLI